MSTNGQLLEVRWEWDGTELSADALAGATVLSVVNADSITVGSQVWVQASGPYTVSNTDVDNDTITLSTGISADLEEGSEVVPDVGGQPGQVWVAEVLLPDADTPIEVPLTVHDLGVMNEGVYDPPVGIVLSDDLQTVVDLPGSLPVINGGYVPSESLPGLGTDGEPPALSPTPEVIGGIGVLHVRWTGVTNADAVAYDVHVSTVDGFVAGPTTYVTTTAGTSATIKTLADGTPITYGPENAPTIYYVRIIAYDEDGAADPSPQDSDHLHFIANEEMSALYGYFGVVTADQIVTGTMSADVTISGIFKTATSGRRVELDNSGLRLYSSASPVPLVNLPTDGSDASFTGTAVLASVVTDKANLRNLIDFAAASVAKLQLGVVPPTDAPTYTIDHALGTQITGLSGGATSSVQYAYPQGACLTATDWLMFAQHPTGYRIHRIPTNGGAQTSYVNGAGTAVVPAPPSGYADWTWRGLAWDGTNPWLVVSSYNSTLNRAIIYAYRLNPVTLTSDGTVQGVSGIATGLNTNVTVWGIAAIGVNIIIGWSQPLGGADQGKRQVTTINNSTAAQTTIKEAANSAPDTGTFGFAAGTFDYGDAITRYVFNDNGTFRVYYNNAGVLTRRINDEWPAGTDGVVGGQDPFFYTGSEFRQFDGVWNAWSTTGPIKWKKFTGNIWGVESSTWWASYIWRDEDSGGTGKHATVEGTRTPGFTMTKRARLNLASAPIPDYGGSDDPDSVTFLVGRGAGAPAAMYPQGGTLAPGVTSLALTAATFSGALPGTALFPAGTPAEFRSAKLDGSSNPLISLKGDGSWRLGYLAGDSDGKDTPWTDFVVATSGVTLGNGTLKGRYKRTGTRVDVTYLFQPGTTTTFPGNPTFDVPITAAAPVGGMRWCGVGFMSKSGGPNWVSGTVNLNSGSDTPSIAWLNDALTGDLNQWSATFPATPANIVYVTWSLTYEVAP